MRHLLVLAALIATPASADVRAAVDEVILPDFAAFTTSARALADTAAADCAPGAVLPAYHAAFDDWMMVSELRIGPSETGALSLSFWPDSRGFTPKTLASLIADEDPIVDDPDAFAEVSIAARGFYALDFLLGDTQFAGYEDGSYTCRLVATLSEDIARQAAALEEGWDGFSQVLLTAGAPDNVTYMHEDEAIRALFTQMVSGLEFTADTRLGRPMGTFDRPRPTRAEAWRTDRPLRNIELSAMANAELAMALSDIAMPATEAALENVMRAVGNVDAPDFQDVGEDPSARFKLEVLQQAIRDLRLAIENEVGAPLGIAPGFNSQDGD